MCKYLFISSTEAICGGFCYEQTKTSNACQNNESLAGVRNTLIWDKPQKSVQPPTQKRTHARNCYTQ